MLANARHIANPFNRNNPAVVLSCSVTSLQHRLAFLQEGHGAQGRFLDKGFPVCDNRVELWEADFEPRIETGE